MKKSYVSLLMCLFVLSLLVSGCGTPKTMAEYQKKYNNELRDVAKERGLPPDDCMIKKLEYNGISYSERIGMTKRMDLAFYDVSVAESPDELIVCFQVPGLFANYLMTTIFISAVRAVGQNPNDIADALGIRSNGKYWYDGMYDKSCRKKNVDYELMRDEINVTLIQTIYKNK